MYSLALIHRWYEKSIQTMFAQYTGENWPEIHLKAAFQFGFNPSFRYYVQLFEIPQETHPVTLKLPDES